MATATREETVTISNTFSRTDKAMHWKVILLNCHCHSFQQVEEALVKIVKCTNDKAKEYAQKVHKEGRCVVFSGHFEQAELKYFHLQKEGLEVELTK